MIETCAMTIAMRGSSAGGDSPQDNQSQSAQQQQTGNNQNQQVDIFLHCLILVSFYGAAVRGQVKHLFLKHLKGVIRACLMLLIRYAS